ncbi:MAG: exodeoxyribonuclease V subunit alpha [bacterium]|nr:exodeoxyribonuclease V subunit alpha [bacterium]
MTAAPNGERQSPPQTTVGDILAPALAAYAKKSTRATVQHAVAVLATFRDTGNVCAPLADIVTSSSTQETTHPESVDDLREALLQSGICAQPAATPGATREDLPLVLDERDRLYLLRDHRTEERIVAALRLRLAAAPVATPEQVRAILEARGERTTAAATDTADEPDWQLAAIAAAATRRFLLLTGGPGTGKTTTVARLLAVLEALTPGHRIALCAPTGKAAARMAEAITGFAEHDELLATIQSTLVPSTLHRLLEYRPLDDQFRRGPERPLPFDTVVVDEASMLDPVLLATLLEALPADSRLVLVGDRDQLAAVAAGQVLGDLCRAAEPDRGVGPSLATTVRAATGMDLPTSPADNPLADHVIQLRTNHRFGAQPGLDHFARALALRQPDAALAVLDDGHPDLVHADAPEPVMRALQSDLLELVRMAPERAVAELGRLRVLAASRSDAHAWNARIETWLAAQGVRVDDPWYPGRPILVLVNDHQNRIYNGDLGVACRDGNGRSLVAFPGKDGGVRYVSAFRIPAHETAWAMTVHKSQGSEFDTVVLAMPADDGPLWQAPLLYTGITRARRRAFLIADRKLLASGCRRWPERRSGLADAMVLPATGNGTGSKPPDRSISSAADAENA